MNTNLIVQIEVTDTFGGEANYAWVKRHEIRGMEGKSDLAIVRAVKKEIDWNGHRCRVENFGDEIWLRPVGVCQVCIITFHTFGSES